MGRQYERHTLARIVAENHICRVTISSWQQYMLLGDNIYREYQHKLSPVTVCVGTTIYIATGGQFTFPVQVKQGVFECSVA